MAISAANVPEFAIVFLGVLQLGGVVTGVNPHFTSEELTNQLKEANAKCIVTDPHLVHRAKEAAKKLGIDHVFVIGEDEDCVSVSDLLKEDESRIPHVTLNPHEDLAICKVPQVFLGRAFVGGLRRACSESAKKKEKGKEKKNVE